MLFYSAEMELEMIKSLSTKGKVISFIFISISLGIFMILLITSIYFAEKEDLLREKNILKKDTVTAYTNILYNYEIFHKSRLSGILNSQCVKEAKIYDKKYIDKSKKSIGNYRVESYSLKDKDLINYLPKDYDLTTNILIKKVRKKYSIFKIS